MREPQLEAQVARTPDDDGPRRVYADWLLEREDPRGEFIVVQLALHHLQGELARLPVGHERRAMLEQRERALLAAHGAQWLDELGLPTTARIRAEPQSTSEQHARGSVVIFRRGFPEEAKLPLRQWVALWRPLHAAPLRKLVLTRMSEAQEPELEALAQCEPCPTLTTLGFRQLRLEREPALQLAATPLLQTVQALQLQEATLLGGVAALADPRLSRLRKLGLTRRSTTEGLEVLASSLPELLELDLEGSDAAPLWGLFRSERLDKLQILNLRDSRADDAVVGAIASSQRPLTQLDLSGWNAFGAEGVQSLVRTRRLSRLKRLRLTRRNLGIESVLALQKKFGDKLVLDDW